MRYFPGTGRCDPELAAPANRRALTEDDLTQIVDDAAGFAGQSATSAEAAEGAALRAESAAEATGDAEGFAVAAGLAAESADESKVAAEIAAASVQKGQPNGTAPLDGDGKLPDNYVPERLSEQALTDTIVPPVARTVTIYLDNVNGSDDKSGRTFVEAKKTLASALTALGSTGGVIELGGTTTTVESEGRFDTCTFTAGSNVVADTAITAGDVGKRVISTYLRSALIIATVNPGVSFTVTDETGRVVNSETGGTAQSIITRPGLVIPPGVKLRGKGNQWTNDQSAQAPILNKSITKIKDTGTGIAVLFGHPSDFGPANSGQNALGGELEDVTVEGNANNMYGIAQINNWGVICKGVASVAHGIGAVLFSGNANTTRFIDCRFSGNGSATTSKVGGGVVHLVNTPEIPFGPVKFDNCFSTFNKGWHVVGTFDFTNPVGARSIRASQGQFNHIETSAVAGSGTQIAVSGRENRSLLDDCIFESADFLNLDVYDAPVTAIACKFLATGRPTGGPLPYQVRVNAGATLDAIGSGFHSATAYQVEVAAGGTFNWRSCNSGAGSTTLAADSSGNALALTAQLGLPAGSTTSPVEPLNGMAGHSRPNETFSRLLVTSDTCALVNQRLNLTYFTATRNGSVSQVAVQTGATPSGGYATLIAVGLYRVNSNGSLTLIAQTSGANNNALQAAAAAVTLNLAAAAFLTQGRRYAVGVLINSSQTLPTFRGSGAVDITMAGAPAICQVVTGQTSLPADIATASLAAGGAPVYSRLL